MAQNSLLFRSRSHCQGPHALTRRCVQRNAVGVHTASTGPATADPRPIRGTGTTGSVAPVPGRWWGRLLTGGYETMNGPAIASTSSGVRVGLTASGKGVVEHVDGRLKGHSRDGCSVLHRGLSPYCLARPPPWAGSVPWGERVRCSAERVWGGYAAENTQQLRVYINYLRRKPEGDPTRPDLILTEPGVGYRLKADPLIVQDTPASLNKR
jgi:hypothetical protein